MKAKCFHIFDPCDPYLTFEVKLLITFVALYPLMILTKSGWNPMKVIEEEANCEKWCKNKSTTETAPFLRARGKLGGMLKRRLYEPRIWTLIWFNIILSSGAKGWLSSNVIRMPLTNFKRL